MKSELRATEEKLIIKEIARYGSDGISPFYIATKLNIDLDLVKNFINKQMAENKLEYCSAGIRTKTLSLDEFIKNIKDEKNKEIIKKRLQGYTLNDIAKSYGLTRQRVDQICRKEIKKCPYQINEDKYKDVFSEYKFDCKTFTLVFKCNKSSYYYLKSRYKKGAKKPTYDSLCSIGIICNELKQVEDQKYLLVNGEKIKKKSNNIISYLIRNTKDYFQPYIIYNKYLQFIRENDLEEERFKISKRYLEMRILSHDVINCYKKGFRYYLITREIAEKFFNDIDLNRYNNTIVSTKKIILDNPNIINEYSLFDEYELHSFLKKACKILHDNKGITFKRMPMIRFGKIADKQFIHEKIKEYAPIEINDFLSLMQREYGYKANTLNSKLKKKEYNKYICGTQLRCDLPIIDNETRTVFKKDFDKEFYFFDDYVTELEEKKYPALYWNENIIRQLGFKTYAGYIISDTYKSAKDYFKKMIYSNDLFSLNNLDKRYRFITMLLSALHNAEKKLDYFMYEWGEYISINKLKAVRGFDKNFFNSYKLSMLDVIDRDTPFTIDSLIAKGFEEKFRDYGFDDCFYSSLFRNEDGFQTISFWGKYVFIISDITYNKALIIENIVNSKGAMSIYDLHDYLINTYSIKCGISSLVHIINNSSLFYNEYTEKIYIDHDQFLEEV